MSGLPLSVKIAWVSTSRAWIIEPPAESPSVRKMLDSSRLGVLRLAKWNLQSVSLGMRIAVCLGALARLLLDRVELLAQPLVGGDLLDSTFGDLRVLVQPDGDRVLDLLHHPVAHLGRAQLVLGLALEHRVLELDRDRAEQPVAHVVARERLAGELVDPLEQALAERALVGAAVVGVLAVDEALVGLAVGVGVGERELEPLVLVVHDRVERRLLAELLDQQIRQAALALERARRCRPA